MCNAPKVPGPEKYNGHKKFGHNRQRSNERNAPKFSIGNDGKEDKTFQATPGPLDYTTTLALQTIGDRSSVGVPFSRFIRPISAKNGQLRQVIQPGPADYKAVPVERFRRRNSVIPSCSFKTAGQQPESADVQRLRAKSPGP